MLISTCFLSFLFLSASFLEREQVTDGVACSNSWSTQDNSETPERSNNGPQNTESIDDNLNLDQNSLADKTRRSEEISEDETSDSNPEPL